MPWLKLYFCCWIPYVLMNCKNWKHWNYHWYRKIILLDPSATCVSVIRNHKLTHHVSIALNIALIELLYTKSYRSSRVQIYAAILSWIKTRLPFAKLKVSQCFRFCFVIKCLSTNRKLTLCFKVYWLSRHLIRSGPWQWCLLLSFSCIPIVM